MKVDYKIILASGSPRRKQLLEQIGLEFEVWPSNAEEKVLSDKPQEVCESLAEQKALDIASGIKTYNEEHSDIASDQDLIIIGADTIVVYDGKILGKPKDESEAKDMLKMLSGRKHSVYTGVSFVFMSKDGRVGSYGFHEKTLVEVYPLSEEEIEEYIASGDPMDKAGAYGIQGKFACYIKGIEGDYNNVVGLPTGRLYQELKAILEK